MDNGFLIKDSGKRMNYKSGMNRDVQDDKPNYLLIDPKFLLRLAIHMTKGAVKYGRDNWRLANSQEELDRFRESSLRHLMQWLNGDVDEDHMSAVAFNLFAAEYVKEKLQKERVPNSPRLVIVPFSHSGTEWYSQYMGKNFIAIQDEDKEYWRVIDKDGNDLGKLIKKKDCRVIGI